MVQLVVIVYHGHQVSMRSIPIMLYTQWVGAIIKIHAAFHLSDQNWSKGKSAKSWLLLSIFFRNTIPNCILV